MSPLLGSIQPLSYSLCSLIVSWGSAGHTPWTGYWSITGGRHPLSTHSAITQPLQTLSLNERELTSDLQPLSNFCSRPILRPIEAVFLKDYFQLYKAQCICSRRSEQRRADRSANDRNRTIFGTICPKHRPDGCFHLLQLQLETQWYDSSTKSCFFWQ